MNNFTSKETAKIKADLEYLYKLNPHIFDEDYVPDGQVCIEQINMKTGEVIYSDTFIPQGNKLKVYFARFIKRLGFNRCAQRILGSIKVP